MKSVKQKAEEWVNKNVILSEHCDIEYRDLIDKLELLLKEQDVSDKQKQLLEDDNHPKLYGGVAQ